MARTSLRFVALSTVLTLSAIAHADALSRDDAKTLATIDANLKRAETSLPLVEQALGTAATPSASKLKLAQSRLAQPKSLITQLQPLMAKLPAEHPDVAPVKKRLDAAAAKLAELETKLGVPAPAAPAGVKLDYRQEQQLKDAQFNVREVEGRADAVEKIIKDVNAAADPAKVDYRTVDTAINTIADARTRAANGATRLAALPADGRNVQPAIDALKAATARLDAAEKTLEPIHAKLMASIDPGAYPTLDADTRRLSELAQMFANPAVLDQRYVHAADLVAQLPAAAEEKSRIVTLYAPIIQQQTEPGKKLAGLAKHFDTQYEAFTAAAEKSKAALPIQIKEGLAQITKYADQAEAEHKPAYFSGGIPQHLEHYEQMIILLAALDAPAAETARKQIADLRADLKTRVEKLTQAIIDANDLPPDKYKGGDRKDLEKAAADAWKKIQPDAQVLAARIPQENWQREEIWRRQNKTWYKIDRSHLQVQLLIKHSDSLAVIRPIDLWKDHLQNDQLTPSALDNPATPPIPQSLLPLNKIK